MKKKYYFFTNQSKMKDMNQDSYDLIINAIDDKYSSTDDGGTYDIKDIENQIRKIKPKRLEITGFTQLQFDFIIPFVKENLLSLSIFKCPKISDLSGIAELNKLLYLDIYWNTKATKLWNIGNKLRKLIITDCNKLTDFEGLGGSKLESLQLYGSDGLSSFKSKLVINDLNIIFQLNTLEELGLNIVKNFVDKDFLIGLSKMLNLKHISLPNNMFTFEQFAWLQSKMKNTKGLEAYTFYEYDSSYQIIGKNTPNNIRNQIKAEEYKNKYDELVFKYDSIECPPSE